MHQNYKIVFDRILHSIPINKFRSRCKSKQLRCLSYSIPLVCVLALFGLVGFAVSLDSGFASEVYAAEGDEKPTYNPSLTMSISGQICSDEEKNIGCEVYGQTVANVGETTYSRAYGVNINGQDMSDYKLTISANNSGALINDGDDDSGDGSESANIPSVASTSGEAMGENTWGYAWFDSTTVSDEEKKGSAYQALSGTQATLKSEQNIEASEINVDGSLVFAAKFGSDAAAGHYKADVLLSLAASPKKVVEGIVDGMYMQDVTLEMCAKTPEGWEGTLVDKRGSDPSEYISYTVRKHEDGNCWMTQNLRLPGGTTISTEDSDLNPGSFVADSTSTTVTTGTTYTLPASSTGGFSGSDYSTQRMNNGITSDDYTLDYGAYYSWCAATAGCKTVGGDYIGNLGDSAGSSICPKGWKLPPVGSRNGSYDQLFAAIGASNNEAGSTLLRNEKYRFNYAGVYESSNISGQGTNGYYWSRVSYSSTVTYYMQFVRDSVIPQRYAWFRVVGQPVRCVVAVPDGFGEIYTMQDMTADVCKNISQGTSGQLLDKRDGSLYAVRKHEDGNCWMTQNLRLPGRMTISTEDSDLNSGSFVVSASSPSTAGTTSYTLPASKTSGFSSDTAHYMYMSPTDAYGGYYSWCTATAGCRKDDGANPDANQDASSSICPKGWKLPLSGDTNASASGSFANLLTKAGIATSGGGSTLKGVPYNFQLAGRYNSSSLDYVGGDGYYWSRTAYSTANGYFLDFDTSNINPASYGSRRRGFSVRCVAVSS